MYWEFAWLGVAVLSFLAAFALFRWGREVRNPERRRPLNHINPGSGGA